MFNIDEELKKLPESPGVYMHKDRLGQIIYVGKAINLRKRVHQYFNKSYQSTNPKVRAMVLNIAEFDYLTCATEMEALILECNLIKKYMPKYNVLMKDGKTYPYIEVTTNEEFPRVIKTHILKRDGNKYFGPYSDVGAVYRILRLIDEIYPIKKCNTINFPANTRPCLNYYINKCKGVCIGAVSKDEYDGMIKDILRILTGHDTKLLSELKEKMESASDKMEYEEAAKYRDYISAVRKLQETQRATMVRDEDIDILLPLKTNKNEITVLYKVRDGKLIGREIFYMDDINKSDLSEVVTSFIKQYYTDNGRLPREIMLSRDIEEKELLEAMLNKINQENYNKAGETLHKTKIVIPERGAKKAVMDLAVNDSLQMIISLDERAERENERKRSLRREITGLIERACIIENNVPYILNDEDEREYRVEAYDISNTNGLDSVGAMVVYEGAVAVKKDYRKFKIKSVEGSDDYGSLQEVIYRRINRTMKGDPAFKTFPDIIFMDGGLGQVRAAKTVIDAFNMSIPVVGLAKDNSHRTRAVVFSDGTEIDLKGNPLLFSYAGTVQEEVHRFAITYHRGVRGKKMTKSPLEQIEGVGPKRRKELLMNFKNIENIKSAGYDELMKVDGISSAVAKNIEEYFKQ